MKRALRKEDVSVVTAPYLHHTLEFALDSIAANGFTQVELWGASPHFCWDDYTKSERVFRIQEIRRMMKERGLRMSVFHPEQVRQYPINIASPDAYLREKSLRVMKDYLEDTIAFGTDRMILAPGWPFVDSFCEADTGRAIESVGILTRRAKELGVTLYMEEMGATSTLFVKDLAGLAKIVKGVGEPNLKACLDVVMMAQNRESAAEYAETFGEIGHIHLADCEKGGYTALGDGELDLTALLAELDGMNYAGSVSLYLPGAGHYQDPDRSVRRSAMWLEKEGTNR
ncbi:MAG: sugar phosphate isomerase/epimerase [Lachnospiraceae bacterium]|nr:sugar phosphate isomerase/epimerase [Lachnospiraceae bacterium]